MGKCIDVLFMFGIVGGIGTSLGLGTPMLTEAVSKLFGIQPSLGLDLSIIAFWTLSIQQAYSSDYKKAYRN